MANYNIYDREDKRRATLDLTKVKLPRATFDATFASLLHAINNGGDPGKIQVLIGLIGATQDCEVTTESDGNGGVVINTGG